MRAGVRALVRAWCVGERKRESVCVILCVCMCVCVCVCCVWGGCTLQAHGIIGLLWVFSRP